MNADEVDALINSLSEETAALREENERLREALRIIAGHQQCIDNLLSNRDVALLALKEQENG